MKFPTKFFWLISAFLIAGYCKAQNFETDTVPQFYDARIDVLGRTVSGIIVIKRENDRCRVLFTSLAGPKLLDLSISTKDYEILYAVKNLKKRLILKLFQKDFALIAGLYLNEASKSCNSSVCGIRLSKKDSVSYKYSCNNRMETAKYWGKNKTLFDVKYKYGENRNDSVFLQHYNFNMKITMGRRIIND